jgi:hypothetical protein
MLSPAEFDGNRHKRIRKVVSADVTAHTPKAETSDNVWDALRVASAHSAFSIDHKNMFSTRLSRWSSSGRCEVVDSRRAGEASLETATGCARRNVEVLRVGGVPSDQIIATETGKSKHARTVAVIERDVAAPDLTGTVSAMTNTSVDSCAEMDWNMLLATDSAGGTALVGVSRLGRQPRRSQLRWHASRQAMAF